MNNIIPINVDRNVSKRHYYDFAGTHLLVSSIFYTYQGEGPHTGHPAVFLRLAGCDIGAKLDCPFCDTRFDFDKGKLMTVEAVAEEIERLAANKAQLVVITGGEPLLQMESIRQLAFILKGFLIQIETNGHLIRKDTLAAASQGIELVVSPKIPHTKLSYMPFTAEFVERFSRGGVYLKYVVSADPTNKYHKLPTDLVSDGPSPEPKVYKGFYPNVYVSAMAVYKKSYPEGRISSIWHTDEIDQDLTAANYRYAAQLALEHGFKVSYQTHLFGGVE